MIVSFYCYISNYLELCFVKNNIDKYIFGQKILNYYIKIMYKFKVLVLVYMVYKNILCQCLQYNRKF